MQVPRRASRFTQRFSGQLPPLPGTTPREADLSDYNAYNNNDSKSARSSMTMGDEAVSHEVALAKEVINVEASMDAYSGGAPAEPTVERVTAPPKEHGDSNVVTWDGPNDLTNPKNWSIKYKYLLSGLCCLCTLNV